MSDMKILLIINDPPYGTEKAYNALRLALALRKNQPNAVLRIFLMADAVVCAAAGQNTPNGFYNIARMLRLVLAKGGEVALCGTCMDARGLAVASCLEGTQRGSMDQLAEWTVEADKTLIF
jgi:uncharacterized protein involved in oxidation of intracellular sulfur